jgi:hypothetical protein
VSAPDVRVVAAWDGGAAAGGADFVAHLAMLFGPHARPGGDDWGEPAGERPLAQLLFGSTTRNGTYWALPAPFHRSARAVVELTGKRAAPRVAFGHLVETGLIAPGAELFDRKRRWLATVRADGSILANMDNGTSTGAITGSIHGVGSQVQGAPACNGWTFWHVEHEGEIKPLDALRQLYLLAVED